MIFDDDSRMSKQTGKPGNQNPNGPSKEVVSISPRSGASSPDGQTAKNDITTLSRRDPSVKFDNPYKPHGTIIDEDDYVESSVDKIDVVLLPVYHRKSTLYPLPFVLTGVISMSISLVTHPWMEYTILAEGMTTGSIFRQHVKTGLFEKCKSTEEEEWDCEYFYLNGSSMTAIQAFFFINVVLGWVALVLCIVQTGKAWIEETDEEATMNVPGVLLIELIAAIFALASVAQSVLILFIFQYLDGGSASNGFFLCEMGVILLAAGCGVAFKVAMKPVREPLPWRVQMAGQEDEEESDEEEEAYF